MIKVQKMGGEIHSAQREPRGEVDPAFEGLEAAFSVEGGFKQPSSEGGVRGAVVSGGEHRSAFFRTYDVPVVLKCGIDREGQPEGVFRVRDGEKSLARDTVRRVKQDLKAVARQIRV